MPRQLADAGLVKSLPSAAEDPVERRRLLNILAQRRYRNRKRARLASLESQLTGQSIITIPDGDSWQETAIQSQHFDGSISSIETLPTDLQPVPSAAINQSGILPSQSTISNSFNFDISSSLPDPDVPVDFTQPFFTSSTSMAFTFDSRQSQTELFQDDTSNDDGMPISQNRSSGYTTSSDFSSADNTSSHLLEEHAWDHLPPENTTLDPLSFNDEAYVTTPGLSVIRAHVTILQRMHRNGGQIDIWNLFSVSPFYQSGAPSALPVPLPQLAASLPDNYKPTALQKAVKHHPVLDLLPWPSVRSKILHILTLPMEFRPQRAQGDMQSVTMQLMFDMKDAGGGLRVWGSNPFDEANWEVGPVFFQQWWWALNSEIVKRSNQIRTQRGEDILCLKNISH